MTLLKFCFLILPLTTAATFSDLPFLKGNNAKMEVLESKDTRKQNGVWVVEMKARVSGRNERSDVQNVPNISNKVKEKDDSSVNICCLNVDTFLLNLLYCLR